jgi:hypothetical protein
MNIHYKNYPTDYIDALQNKGKRLKARCFWEYYNDVQVRQVNSIGFYAKSWGGNDKPMSKGSVHKWVGEFKVEIQRHYDALSLVNTQHYSSVVKQSERKVNDIRTNEQPQSTTTTELKENECTASERQVNKALIINNNIKPEQIFEGFYFMYRQFNKYAGNKADAKQSFLNVEDVDLHRLSVASMFYLSDSSIAKHVGAKKFLDNNIYLNYMDMYLKVYVSSTWLSGSYNTDKEIFTCVDGKEYALDATKLAEKFGKQEIEILREVA